MEGLDLEALMQMGEVGTGYAADLTIGMDPMSAALFAGFAGLGLLALIMLVIILIARCFVFQKMGHKWYEAIISGHNLFILITNAGKPGRWIFAPVVMILPIPVVAQVVGAILSLLVWISINIGLAKKFGKGTGFGIGLIVLPFIFYPILAWGKAKYSRK